MIISYYRSSFHLWWKENLVKHWKVSKYYAIVLSYLQSYYPPDNERTYNTRSILRYTIKTFATLISTFCVTFFPYCTKKWNQLNNDINKAESIKKLRKTLIKVIRTKENPIFGVSDIYAIKVLTRLRLNFSHLNEAKFRNNFNDTINPTCNCGAATETTIHYLWRYQRYSLQRVELLNVAYKLDSLDKNNTF